MEERQKGREGSPSRQRSAEGVVGRGAEPGRQRPVLELHVAIEPLSLRDSPRHHELSARVDVGLDPAVPRHGSQKCEDRVGKKRREQPLQGRSSARCFGTLDSRLSTLDSLRIPPVQEKMATRNRLARAVASATSRVWFPATLAFARAFPRRAMHRWGRGLARVYYRLHPKYLRAARANLSVILGVPEGTPEVRRLAFEMVASHFSAWVDFLQFATRTPAESALLVESVTGYSRIVEGRLAGKGVLLLTAHLGNWEVGGLMLAQVRQPIHVVLVPDIFPGVERERRRLHERSGVTEIRVDRSFVPTLTVLRALSANAI